MKTLVWLLLISVGAVVAATLFGRNDGLVTISWLHWRVELSLNLAIALVLLLAATLAVVWRALAAVTSLPRRAGEWRSLQRERSAHAALVESLDGYLGGRYARSQKAAARAVSLAQAPAGDPQLLGDSRSLQTMARLLAGASAHRLRDTGARDAWVAPLQASAPEAAHLMQVEWALDDGDPHRALDRLAQMPPGVARRAQALRLRLRAARQAGQRDQALSTARLLVKHQAFGADASQSLIRALTIDCLEAARDAQELRQTWHALETAEQRDPIVASRAAVLASRLGAGADGAQWLVGVWDRIGDLPPDTRVDVGVALAAVAPQAGSNWLARAEHTLGQWPGDAAVALGVGSLYASHQLWGKARPLLERAAQAQNLPRRARQGVLQRLAQMARAQGDEARAERHERELLQLA